MDIVLQIKSKDLNKVKDLLLKIFEIFLTPPYQFHFFTVHYMAVSTGRDACATGC